MAIEFKKDFMTGRNIVKLKRYENLYLGLALARQRICLENEEIGKLFEKYDIIDADTRDHEFRCTVILDPSNEITEETKKELSDKRKKIVANQNELDQINAHVDLIIRSSSKYQDAELAVLEYLFPANDPNNADEFLNMVYTSDDGEIDKLNDEQKIKLFYDFFLNGMNAGQKFQDIQEVK